MSKEEIDKLELTESETFLLSRDIYTIEEILEIRILQKKLTEIEEYLGETFTIERDEDDKIHIFTEQTQWFTINSFDELTPQKFKEQIEELTKKQK